MPFSLQCGAKPNINQEKLLYFTLLYNVKFLFNESDIFFNLCLKFLIRISLTSWLTEMGRKFTKLHLLLICIYRVNLEAGHPGFQNNWKSLLLLSIKSFHQIAETRWKIFPQWVIWSPLIGGCKCQFRWLIAGQIWFCDVLHLVLTVLWVVSARPQALNLIL